MGWRWHSLARVENQAIARAVSAAKLPVVDVSAARLLKGVPWVETDDTAIARMAVDHLLDRGFRHLAFTGNDAFNSSKWRQRAFVVYAKEAGVDGHAHHTSKSVDWEERVSDLFRWLETLFKQLVGRTPHEEIERVKLTRVKALLRGIDLSIEEIADRSGYRHAEYLSTVFKRRTGVPPSTYRRG